MVSCVPLGFLVSAAVGKSMQTIETTNPKEARRCRYALFLGEKKTVTLMGSTIRGVVYSVMEDCSVTPKRWIVKIDAE
jgi:hypothetical protein